MSEAEALLLDRSHALGEHETALEEGWLLVELEQRFGYGLEELARRFDRSPSWVSRRMALVELLPESVQQQVRSGAITAHVAMKFLVPVARSRPEDCQRMAEAICAASVAAAAKRDSCMPPGEAHRGGPRSAFSIEPQLFLKTQRQREPESALAGHCRTVARSGSGGSDHAQRANRRLSRRHGGTGSRRSAPRRDSKIRSCDHELGRLAAQDPTPKQGGGGC